LPGHAMDLCLYFPEDIRRMVDQRDKRTCVRCHRHISDGDIRYHKISHPGPVDDVDNCATLCKRCRSRYVNRKVIGNRKLFKDMRYDGFVALFSLSSIPVRQ